MSNISFRRPQKRVLDPAEDNIRTVVSTPHPIASPTAGNITSTVSNLVPAIKASSVPFPKMGLKVSYLLSEFVAICGGRAILQGKTTTEVNHHFQKNITKSAKLSYCDYLNQLHSDHPAVGIATVFISHAWKYEFLDVLDALQSYFTSNPETIIWFDVFSVNQHVEVDLDFDWWSNSFKSAIRDFGRTVMVLAPWHDPIPLQRGWCLFEIYSTIVTESQFEVAMTESSRNAFLEDVTSNTTGATNKMLAAIDVEKSECFKQEDRERIFEIVRREVGMSEINSMIFECMRTWVIETTDTALKADPDNLTLMTSLATLYQNQHRYDKAEPLFVACLEKRRISLGQDHPDTLLSMSNLAVLYMIQGQNEKAEPLFVACYEKQRTALGQSHHPNAIIHLNALTTMNNLAVLYKRQGSYKKAEPMYVACLEEKRIYFGESHPETFLSMNNLALLYDTQGQYGKAEPLFVACLDKQRTALGENHPHTLLTMSNLASLYMDQGLYEISEPLYVSCLERQRIAFGESHPDTLRTMNNLAVLYRRHGQYEKAEPLYLSSLETKRAALGENHPDTLITMNGLGILYFNHGEFVKAESIWTDCLKLREAYLGVNHRDTIDTRNSLDKLRAVQLENKG